MFDSDSAHQLVHELGHNKNIKIHREDEEGSLRSLSVSFQRTLRVSDNGSTNDLPPSFGNFPLSEVSKYTALPPQMKAKGGYFFPMHRKHPNPYLTKQS